MSSRSTKIKTVVALTGLCFASCLSAAAEEPPVVGGVEAVGYTSVDATTGAYNQPGWVRRRLRLWRPLEENRELAVVGPSLTHLKNLVGLDRRL